MMKIMKTIFLMLSLSITNAAEAKLQILTTTTNLSWLAQQIAGDKAEVVPLLTGVEDVHYINAKPSFISKASNADILCSVGLGLELGWLPKVLEKSGNAQIQPRGKGYCVLGEGIDVLDKVTKKVDRSMGDVHPEGNPHFSLSPDHLIKADSNFVGVLATVDPTNSDYYLAQYKKTKSELQQLRDRIRKELSAKLEKGTKILEYHKEFTYFFHAYGLHSAGSMEELPGVPPSAGRIAKVALKAKATGVKAAISAPYSPQKIVQRVSAIAKIPSVVLPVHVRANTEYNSYPKLQKHLAAKLIKTIKPQVQP